MKIIYIYNIANVYMFQQTNHYHVRSKKFLPDLLQWKRVLPNINNTSMVLCEHIQYVSFGKYE